MMLPGPGIVPRQRRGPPNPRAKQPPRVNAALWWNLPPADALLTAVLPKQQPFRQDNTRRVDLLLRVRDDDDDNYELTRLLAKKGGRGKLYETVESLLCRLDKDSVHGPGIRPWGVDYMDVLRELATARGMSVSECARRFGTVTLPDSDTGWRFHSALGFAKLNAE